MYQYKRSTLASGDLTESRLGRLASLSLSALLLASLTVACGGDPTGGGREFDNAELDPRGSGRRVKSQVGQDERRDTAKPKITRAAKELFILAGQRAEAQRYDDAISNYQDAYERDNKLAVALYNIGHLNEVKGDLDEARRFYKLAGQAGVGEGWVNLGLFALKERDQAQAQSYFEAAIGVDKLNGRAHLNLALFAKERGEMKRARGHIRKALMENSRNIDAYDLLAQLYCDQGRYRLALLVTDSGLSNLTGNRSGLLTTQGVIQVKTDDINGAVRSFEEAIKDSNNFAARLNLGLLTFGYRDYERSYQLLTAAVKLKPKHVSAALSLAVTARTLKRYDEARQGYEKVLTLVPNHPGAIFNLTVLDQDYTPVDSNDFNKRTILTKSAIARYQKIIGLTQEPELRKKIKQRLADANIVLESIEAERDEAAAEAAEAAEAKGSGTQEGQDAP